LKLQGLSRDAKLRESWVPIVLKVVTISLDEVSPKNLSGLLAQFCSTVDVGSGGGLISS